MKKINDSLRSRHPSLKQDQIRVNLIPRMNWACLSAAIISGAILRGWNFWKPSLWLDECVSAWVVYGSWTELWYRCTLYLAHSPFYYSWVKFSTCLFGNNEFAVRLPSIFAGTFSIYLIYRLGEKISSSHLGLCAAWIFAIHPWFIHFSQEARPYAISVVFALLSCIALWHVLENPNFFPLLFYSISSSLLVYSQYLFAPFVAFQFVFGTISLGRQREEKEKRIKFWLLAHLGIGISLGLFHSQLSSLWQRGNSLHYQLISWKSFLLVTVVPDFLQIICLGMVFPIIWLLHRMSHKRSLRFVSIRYDPHIVFYLALWYLMPWPLYSLFVWKTGATSFWEIRYFLIYLIPASFLIGWIITRLREWRYRLMWAGSAWILFFFIVLAPRFFEQGVFFNYQGEDWRGVSKYIENSSGRGSIILMRSGLVESDLIVSQPNPDPGWIGLAESPLIRANLDKGQKLILLPYHWDGKQTEKYLQNHIFPQIQKQGDFWFINRNDVEAPNFLLHFYASLYQRGWPSIKNQHNIPFAGISVVHWQHPPNK